MAKRSMLSKLHCAKLAAPRCSPRRSAGRTVPQLAKAIAALGEGDTEVVPRTSSSPAWPSRPDRRPAAVPSAHIARRHTDQHLVERLARQKLLERCSLLSCNWPVSVIACKSSTDLRGGRRRERLFAIRPQRPHLLPFRVSGGFLTRTRQGAPFHQSGNRQLVPCRTCDAVGGGRKRHSAERDLQAR
jgi:hypothetical protein